MIELTEEQRKSIQDGQVVRVHDHVNGHDYVMLRPDVYDDLVEEDPDDSRWTAEEMDFMREESVAILDRYGTEK